MIPNLHTAHIRHDDEIWTDDDVYLLTCDTPELAVVVVEILKQHGNALTQQTRAEGTIPVVHVTLTVF